MSAINVVFFVAHDSVCSINFDGLQYSLNPILLCLTLQDFYWNIMFEYVIFIQCRIQVNVGWILESRPQRIAHAVLASHLILNIRILARRNGTDNGLSGDVSGPPLAAMEFASLQMQTMGKSFQPLHCFGRLILVRVV